MPLRLDTLLLVGTNDIAHYLVEGNLSAAEAVRLSMCCKGLKKFLLAMPGLLYLPVHRSLPCITGLALGRKSSYYLSILKGYFGKPHTVSHRLDVLQYFGAKVLDISSKSVDDLVNICVRENRDDFCSVLGRRIISSCLEEIRQCVEFEKQHDLIGYEKQVDLLNCLLLTVNHAFCVTRRHLLPGITKPIMKPVSHDGIIRLCAWFFLSDGESDGLDN